MMNQKKLDTKVLNKLPWKQLTNKTISSSSQREDISSYVDEYDELLFVCKQATGTRHYAPILIPTALMKSWANGTMYFETGAYASATAHNGIRFLIAKSDSTYKIGVEWNFFEGTANNTYVSVLGK